MKIEALKSIFDIEEGKIYEVIKSTEDRSMVWVNVSVLDGRKDLMVLSNDHKLGNEFEVVEE